MNPNVRGDSHQNLPPPREKKDRRVSAFFYARRKRTRYAHQAGPETECLRIWGSCTDRANVTPDAAWAGALYMGSLHGSRKLSLSIVQA
uniref:Uncharacterized protein n=1 Tax=Klebsiella pneumoniae TaxID=573 RepID=A0A410J4H5_KLEPN|nr:hypothetical protein [Klebsiella pneumoniae]QKY85369.1 hypothetical protein [Escherichia coli]QKY86867.1 hypothetical protein [Escherichia coli]UCK63584.1 hypothetical protein NPJCGCDB_00068 [Klebsiella pneumoniae]